MQEILAERDGLRAEFAVERLRIERAMERVQLSKGADMAAIGRHSVAAARLADEVAALRRLEQAQDVEIKRLSRDSSETNAEAGALQVELFDALGLAERKAREAESAHADLRELAESRRLEIASLERRAAELEEERAAKSSRSREEGLAASIRNRLEIAMAQATRHESSGLSLRRELDEAQARIRQLEGERHSDRAEPLDPEEADGGLRSSIHALGLAVATMAREGRNGTSNETLARRTMEPISSAIDAT